MITLINYTHHIVNKNHRRITTFKYRVKKQFVDINLYYLLV